MYKCVFMHFLMCFISSGILGIDGILLLKKSLRSLMLVRKCVMFQAHKQIVI